MMPKQYVAVQFRLKLGKLSIAAQSCPTTRAVTPRLSLFSDDGILNLFHITCFYIRSMFSKFIFRFPVPLILLIQKGHNTHQQTSFELKKFCTEFANVTSLPVCSPQVVDVPEYFIEQEGFCNLTSCYCFARPIYDKK